MTKYIAKPSLFNNKDLMEFDDAKSAVVYLNSKLSAVGSSPDSDYVYIEPQVSSKHLKRYIEEYVWIGKLIVQE